MDPLLSAALGSFVRAGLLLVVPFLINAGIWTPEEATKYVAAATTTSVALGWSVWQKHKSRLKFLEALSVPAGTPETAITGDKDNISAHVTADNAIKPNALYKK